jgi:hypothetical protein
MVGTCPSLTGSSVSKRGAFPNGDAFTLPSTTSVRAYTTRLAVLLGPNRRRNNFIYPITHCSARMTPTIITDEKRILGNFLTQKPLLATVKFTNAANMGHSSANEGPNPRPLCRGRKAVKFQVASPPGSLTCQPAQSLCQIGATLTARSPQCEQRNRRSSSPNASMSAAPHNLFELTYAGRRGIAVGRGL